MVGARERRLHPAPPDYGIVEVIDEAREFPRFIVYHLGKEVGASLAADEAWRFAECHSHGAGVERS